MKKNPGRKERRFALKDPEPGKIRHKQNLFRQAVAAGKAVEPANKHVRFHLTGIAE